MLKKNRDNLTWLIIAKSKGTLSKSSNVLDNWAYIVYMKKTAKTDNLNYQFIAVSFIYILALYLASPLNIGRYIESCGRYVTNIRTIIITA